jgi:hypothetical protein
MRKPSNWKQVLETAETAMSQGFGRGWLDIQRYAIRACDELGYKNAAKALRSELKALLADYAGTPQPDHAGRHRRGQSGNDCVAAQGRIRRSELKPWRETEGKVQSRCRFWIV